MGTLGAKFIKLFQTGQDDPPSMFRAAAEDCSLRALPMEDIWLFRKPMDNSRVVRAVNPDDNLASLKALGSAALGMTLLIGLLMPSAYNLMAGYRIHQLQQEKSSLMTEKARHAIASQKQEVHLHLLLQKGFVVKVARA